MQKSIIPVFHLFNAVAVAGSQTVTQTPPTATQYKDNITFQAEWTGTLTGTFAVQVSLDYVPGAPQGSGGPSGPANAGTWITLPCLDSSGNPPVASGAAGQVIFEINQTGAPWIRLQYTNTSGTGTLDAYVSGKAIGV